MLISRSVIYQTVPIIGAILLLATKSQASTAVEIKANNFSKQGRSSSTITNRQADIFNYLDNIKLSKDGNNNLISQTNSVKQLQDIRSTDWSYRALTNLIERYGCISGFEDKTFRGTQNISRAEFAAGLNSCLNNIETVFAQSKKNTSD